MNKELYRPSNGTEGDSFMLEFCYNCKNDSEEEPCDILGLTFIYDVEDKEYPEDWQYINGKPTCKRFNKSDK